VALGTLFDQVADLAPLVDEKGLLLDFHAPPGGDFVLCDVDRIHQVFSNLVGNAIKFTPPGGHIRVRASVREEWVEFEVSDSGPGIAADVMPHLFQRFRRTTRERGGGTGLGLSIVKGIVDAHGGTLSAGNREGGGAVFLFTLPRKRGQAAFP
jgi:signal transduction histidine kinase